MGKRILLLEKERNLAHFLSLELQKEQYRVDQVEEGQIVGVYWQKALSKQNVWNDFGHKFTRG